ncbi:MAG: AraC family transcriptional regulator [Tissierellaceae bacterium]|nr:AraC family transcriptional regulator [Tissierellaceae bacterium]
MKDSFDQFIEDIPINIHCNTKSYMSTNVAIFIPKEFVIEKEVKTLDYHFVIFNTTPPPLKIGGVKAQFKKGNFISIEPGVYLEVSPIHSVGNVSFISICIKKEFFNEIAQQIVDLDKIKFKNKGNAYSHQILDLIGLWTNEIIAFGENCSLMIESIETLMVIQLLRDSLPNKLIDGRNKFSDNDYISKAIEYMNEYYNSNITIAEICKSIYISPCHFQRIFKKYMDQTPYNYLMELRVNKAKERILEDSISMEEVARLCGFVSAAHFSSVFKRMEGVSPTEFKRNN